MERSEISLHEIKIAAVFKADPAKWHTNKEVATLAAPISERTVRSHTLRLVGLGLLDQAQVFPAHRYRWSGKSKNRNNSYFQRLEKAAEIFGVKF